MTTRDEAPVMLVTGARKGIGRALSEHLVGRGCTVVGCSRKAPDWHIEGFTHLEADVTDERQVKSVLRHIGQKHGRLYGLVNNAGAASMNHALLTPLGTLNNLLATNVLGTFLVSREAVKLMRKAGVGRIVNISSVAVPLRLEGQSAYVASKAAMESLSQVMAREVADYNITVNVVGATPIDTDMIRGVPEDTMKRLVNSFPVKRMGTFEDVNNLVDFFLRPESSAITGQVVLLGGVPNI